jgi:hypothetical protein|tara:strand:+ start:114 stop:539 length:426 start_codon:yes stop_codon:yes gene_type:complete
MSTLHANTIQTSSGGPVTLTKQGAAKAIFSVAHDGTSITDTSGAINTSSLTDNATADRTIHWTNNITNRIYNLKFDNIGYGAAIYDRTAAVYHDFSDTGAAGTTTRSAMQTGSCRFLSFYEGSDRAFFDYANFGVVHGDLA